jgi:endonuclease YncB( thermonuclease family)
MAESPSLVFRPAARIATFRVIDREESIMPGVLRVRGTIDLAQFWPDGDADADTSKVKVTVGKDSFAFAADGKKFKPTNVYFGASSRGTSKKEVIDAKNRITVRLQGIDAPELHYKAGALRKSDKVTDAKRKKFNEVNRLQRRQYWAETSTVALCKKLSAFAPKNKPVACEVISLIDKPFEVIDTYGRFVANIHVGKGYSTDINLWLCQEGWAYPTFYSSMTTEEIQAYLDVLARAKKKGRVAKAYSTDTSKFDSKLVFRKKGPIDAAKDKGKVLMPKVFRRQVAYRMQKAAKISTGSFKAYLEANKDFCFLTPDFIDQGVNAAVPRRLDEFLKGSKFLLDPHEVVFKEKYSDLVGKNGKKLEKF